MRYMVSVNTIAWRWGIPAVFCCYLFFLVWDHAEGKLDYANRSRIVEKHQANVKATRTIDGLILGGSNAVFSLSAEQLTNSTGRNWYNAALLNEGFSEQNYEGFVTQLGAVYDLAKVSSVVYSSISPYRVGTISQRRSSVLDINGNKGVSIKPSRSALSYAKSFVTSKPYDGIKLYPLPAAQGDFRFDQFACGEFPQEDMKYEREQPDTVVDFLVERVEFLFGAFPSATLYITLPSEWYPSSAPSSADFEKQVTERFTTQVEHRLPAAARRVRLIFQPPYPSMDYVCDGRHHANQQGRTWRTDNLIKAIGSTVNLP